jgi:8-oxo-dGTP pyrophosphatase MutT (NUDIX family)
LAFEENDELFADDPNKYVRKGASVAAIILYENNHILLTKRAGPPFKGYWCLPGGKVDSDETPEEAVIREVKEETGVDIEILYKTGEYIERGAREGVAYEYYPTCFLVKDIGGKKKAQPGEVSELNMFNLSDIPYLAFSHNMMLEDFVMKQYGTDHCPKCNSTEFNKTFKMNGWSYWNGIQAFQYMTCKKCGCHFTKELLVTR